VASRLHGPRSRRQQAKAWPASEARPGRLPSSRAFCLWRQWGQADQRSGGSLPSLKPGEILGAVAWAECFTGCWGDVFERGVWLGFPGADGPSSCVGTVLVLKPAVFVEPMLLAIVVSPGPRPPETYHSFAGFAAWARGAC
jgi:hypothetical protein